MNTVANGIAITSLRKDLASFADPGELGLTTHDDRWYRATWLQNGRQRRADFLLDATVTTIPLSVRFGSHETTYAGFLSGTHMADLLGVARVTAAHPNLIGAGESYVPLRAQSEMDEEGQFGPPELAEPLIDDLASVNSPQTKVIFISADAGVGKTTLLREMVRKRAGDYSQGSADCLWLYVDAQGSRLAQLDQAIAAAIDDVRGRFPYHAAIPLVRSGALAIVVDGFDELIGSVGSYDEAFGSLASFIADLGGGGCIVAAARSAYYEQEFLTRASKLMSSGDSSWVLHPVKLCEWSATERLSYVKGASQQKEVKGDRNAYVDRVLASLEAQDVRLIGYKPFFVSKVAEILASDELPEGAGLLNRLVMAYLKREVEKLRSADTNQPILSVAQYSEFLVEISEEMWRQESRQLDRGSVREVGELLGEMLEISNDGLAEVVERLPYTAFLTSGSIPGSIGFTHDIFYSYFLADPVASVWGSGDTKALRRLLRRGRLPEDAAQSAGKRSYEIAPQTMLKMLIDICATTGADREQVRRNAGSLAAGMFARHDPMGSKVKGFVFGDVDFTDQVIRNVSFEECEFEGTDLSRTLFVNCAGTGLQFDRVIVSELTTRLEFEGVQVEDFLGLGVRDNDRVRWLYSPVDMRESLAVVGLTSARQNPRIRQLDPAMIKLVESLCRLFRKTNSITENDGNEMQQIVDNPHWETLKTVMIRSGVLTRETKATSGRKVFLTRLVRPQDIMVGVEIDAVVPGPVKSMWDALEGEEMRQGW